MALGYKSQSRFVYSLLTAGNGGHKMSWYSWSTIYGFFAGYRL